MVVSRLIVTSLRFAMLGFGWPVRSVRAKCSLLHLEDFSF